MVAGGFFCAAEVRTAAPPVAVSLFPHPSVATHCPDRVNQMAEPLLVLVAQPSRNNPPPASLSFPPAGCPSLLLPLYHGSRSSASVE